MPERVLCVVSSLERGGVPSVVMNYYRNIDRNKIQFDFVKHTQTKDPFEDEVDFLGGHVFNAPRYNVLNTLAYEKWWQIFLSEHPEYRIIHGHYYTIASVYLKQCKKAGRITIDHSHSTDVNGKGIRKWAKTIIARRGWMYSDYLFSCSCDAGRWLYGDRDFRIIHNSIDSNLYVFDSNKRNDVRSKLGITKDTFVIGTVGRLESVKNPLGIIEILQATQKSIPKIKLLWIGDGTKRQWIEKELKRRKLETSVLLLGSRNDVNELLQAMDCFILPSFHEGLPVTLVEAQTAGLACYCSETVSKEAAFTEECYFLPINAFEEWADMISKNSNKRINNTELCREAGYDILKSSQDLLRFYLSICR